MEVLDFSFLKINSIALYKTEVDSTCEMLLRPTSSSLSRLYFSHRRTQIRSFYPELHRPDPTKPFPWRHVTVPPSKEMQKQYAGLKQYPIHVVTYNPKGKAVRPPEPIVLIHGLTTNYSVFSTLARELNYPYGLIAMDLVGRGQSHKEDEEKTGGLLRHVLDYIRVLNYFGYMRSFIAGQDIGGIIGYLTCLKYPDRINGIAMIDSGFSRAQVSQVQPLLSKEIEHLADGIEWSTRLGFDTMKLQSNVDLQDYINVHNQNTEKSKTQLHSAAIEDLQSLQAVFEPEFDELMKIRNPITLARPERGSLVDSKTQKEIENYMHIKKSVVVKGAESCHQILLEPSFAKQVAVTIDHLLSEYDEHRRVEILFEKIKAADVPTQKSEE